jgi:hypothetical protein
VRASDRLDSYSRFLLMVAAASAVEASISKEALAHRKIELVNRSARDDRAVARSTIPRETAITARTASAISGRYIRRSAPTSVAIGTKLEVGASVMKTQAPRNPRAGRRPSAIAVRTRRTTTISA